MSGIDLQVAGGLAVVTIDAPERRNSLTVALARELRDACAAIDADLTVGAAVVTGAGPAFCAGADRTLLAAVGADPTDDEAFRGLKTVYDSFARVGRLQVPTVTAVAGPAVGAGVNLALAGDLCVIGLTATLKPGFVEIGAHPGGGHFHLLERRAGRQMAAAAGLFGQAFTGGQAVDAGLAFEAVPDGEVLVRARELAAVPAADPELSRLAVETFDRELDGPGLTWPAAVQLEHAPQMWSLRRRTR